MVIASDCSLSASDVSCNQQMRDGVFKTHDIDHTFAVYCVAGMLPDIRRPSCRSCAALEKASTTPLELYKSFVALAALSSSFQIN